ncbi:hypothetical protein [uncultured Rhodoblastus sp.]|uniref:hypothetical protein n=1 Tax=uncultured Rhodoblastus sp. TaxID=543037 RepID=UPI0025F0F929|nr:hypothetical protein [uncultured Rhodoblastus sp.]
MQYIVRTDMPFVGNIQSCVLENGTVAYTNGLTPDQYAAERGFPVRIVDDDELDAMTNAYVNSLITEPVEETEADFDYALNVLPPSRWRVVRGVEMFHVVECQSAFNFDPRSASKDDPFVQCDNVARAPA